ncbi:MAG: hypothetical protein OEZ10_02295 [Gammaproteobacteria bacterium]|nr:hypothetical protein [Gammaproteobacteria bacterium]
MKSSTPKKVAVRILVIVTMSIVLLGSCTGMGVLYVKSPYLDIKDLDQQGTLPMFFVAFMAKEKSHTPELHVVPYRTDDAERYKTKYPDLDFRVPEKEMSYRWEPEGEAYATVKVLKDSGDSQEVEIFMAGDSGFSSVSIYRVTAENSVVPLKSGHSMILLLVAIFFVPVLVVYFLQKPVTRVVYRLVGIQTKI